MYLIPEDGQEWPKHVACVDDTNTACCVSGSAFISSQIIPHITKHKIFPHFKDQPVVSV